MSSSPNHFLQSEPAKIEQIITEFFTKSLHIILEARSPFVSSRTYSGEQILSSPSSSSSSSSVRSRDKWFNLALRESPTVLENVDIWRQSNLDPLIVDVILTERSVVSDVAPRASEVEGNLLRNFSSKEQPHGLEEYQLQTKNEKIIERWILQYESRMGSGRMGDMNVSAKRTCGSSSQSSEVLSMYRKTYKKSIILLRSLYVTSRLLPAYKVFRDLNSSGQIHPFNLSCKVSSFTEAFTRREEAGMQQFGFFPVETCCGRLCLSVVYHSILSDVKSKHFASIIPQFITDYVGSPTTDPIRRYPSVPLAGLMSRSPGSPSSGLFARRHSWSNDLHRAAPSFSPSPSPTYSDSNALRTSRVSHLSPAHLCGNKDTSSTVSSPSHPPDTPSSNNLSLAQKKDASFDEYWPSPPFSPSPSPSPPTHLPSSHLPKVLLRSESDPLSIPLPRLSKGSILPSHALPPFPCLRGSKSRNLLHSDNARPQIFVSSGCQNSPPKSKCWTKPESSKLKKIQTGATVQKAFSLGKEEVRNVFVESKISPHGCPRISHSRSSSRHFQEEDDDAVFDCPFAVDDEDDLIMGTMNRVESYGTKESNGEAREYRGVLPVRKSQDAAVGALVRMLQSAAPLRQDCSGSFGFAQASRTEHANDDKETKEPEAGQNAADSGISASKLLLSRTTSDALEEFRSYREMKCLLLRDSDLEESPAVQKEV